jgi:hypothetical protein
MTWRGGYVPRVGYACTHVYLWIGHTCVGCIPSVHSKKGIWAPAVVAGSACVDPMLTKSALKEPASTKPVSTEPMSINSFIKICDG